MKIEHLPLLHYLLGQYGSTSFVVCFLSMRCLCLKYVFCKRISDVSLMTDPRIFICLALQMFILIIWYNITSIHQSCHVSDCIIIIFSLHSSLCFRLISNRWHSSSFYLLLRLWKCWWWFSWNHCYFYELGLALNWKL